MHFGALCKGERLDPTVTHLTVECYRCEVAAKFPLTLVRCEIVGAPNI